MERAVVAGRSARPSELLHVCNLGTYASIGLACLALIVGIRLHDPHGAAMAMAGSVIADSLDGWWARRFKRSHREERFGQQLDSLADAMVSGITPPLILLSLAGETTGAESAIQLVAFVAYAICAATRLGYFNVSDEGDSYFTGLPTPVATLIVASAMLWPVSSWVAIVLLLSLAVAMVSGMRIGRPRGRALLVFLAWPASVIALHAWIALG